VREAADRVLASKARIFGPTLAQPLAIDPAAAVAAVGTPAHAAVAQQIAGASITLLEGRLSPLPARPLIIATRMGRRFGPSVETQLRAALAALGWDNVDLLMIDPTPDSVQMQQAIDTARAAGWAALLHFNQVASFDPEAVLASSKLAELARGIGAAGVPLAIVSMGSPYVLPPFLGAGAVLCSYSTCDASVQATLRVLSGRAEARGHLPVTLS
jgi:NaMN:DMB phosphoribosyltransferase